MTKRRVVFMGTPDFAVPALERLVGSDACELALVVTQPDRPAGRGKRLVAPAVKVAAERLGAACIQTSTLRDAAVRERIVATAPDLIVVAAFGMILGRWVLELPPRGCVNLHASLLPSYRGANPIAAAIAMGEGETGVTLMQMDRGLDTGGIYAMSRLGIAADDTTESLTPKLAEVGGNLLEAHLPALLNGNLKATPQPAGATLTRQMVKDDGWLDFRRPAVELERHVRAMWSWPRAWTTLGDGTRIQVHSSQVRDACAAEPGIIVHDGKSVLVACGSGSLELLRVQLPGGRPIEGHALQGSGALSDGVRLGQTGGPGERPPLVMPA